MAISLRILSSLGNPLSVLSFKRSPIVGRTIRPINSRLLQCELLEDRLLLTAAVGAFERLDEVDVYARTNAHATTTFGQWVHDPGPIPAFNFDEERNLAYSTSTAQEGFDANGDFAFSHGEALALNPTPTGEFITAPFVNVNTHANIRAQGSYAEARAGWPDIPLYSVSYGAYDYAEDSNAGTDLYFRGHLYVARYGGEAATEFAAISNYGGISSAITIYYVPTARYETFYLNYSVSFPEQLSVFLPGFDEPLVISTADGVNYHAHFSLPPEDYVISELLPVKFSSSSSQYTGAASFAEDNSAVAIWSQVGESWGYITPDDEDVNSGDFDYDGDVDAADYEIWKEGKPQADANLDGKVDALDYAVWATNVDGILVSTLTDESDGDYSYGELSLREALLLAADSNHPGSDIIAFDENLFGGTITINPSLGPLNIANTSEVNILGPGADQLTIDGNGVAAVFGVLGGGSSPLESTIANLELTNALFGIIHGTKTNHDLVLDKVEIVGNTTGIGFNGKSDLTIFDSLIANNSGNGFGRFFTFSTTSSFKNLTITGSEILDNGNYGINMRTVDVQIYNSEIAGNSGGINFQNGDLSDTLTVTNSTIAENNGAGISLSSGANADIRNTTISNNDGVGMTVSNSAATLTNVTITQNRVSSSSATAGLYANSGGTIALHNTIVAHNYAGSPGSEVLADLGQATTGSFSVGTSSYNMIGVVGNSGITTSQNNIILGSTGDPGLTALGNYGGPTRTHALQSTSQAIDAGDSAKAIALGLLYDQRGEGYKRIVDWDEDLDFDVDIGAFELALSEMFS